MEAAVRSWALRKLGSIDHELRVARAAGLLLDITQGWHGLGGAERRLLVLGALLHDVGRSVEEHGHSGHGARLILESRSLPLSESDRRKLAYLVKHHRGKVPASGTDKFLLHREGGDESAKMRVLLGLLRAADALDSRRLPPPGLLLTRRERRLTIRGYFDGDERKAAEILGRPKKFRLLEETLDCTVRVEWYARQNIVQVP
jgi:exopolyphosphatase/pppGpp-phosphohydrolase